MKKVLTGYCIENWKLIWGAEQAMIPSLWKTKNVYYDMYWRNGIKVKITIEEIKEKTTAN